MREVKIPANRRIGASIFASTLGKAQGWDLPRKTKKVYTRCTRKCSHWLKANARSKNASQSTYWRQYFYFDPW